MGAQDKHDKQEDWGSTHPTDRQEQHSEPDENRALAQETAWHSHTRNCSVFGQSNTSMEKGVVGVAARKKRKDKNRGPRNAPSSGKAGSLIPRIQVTWCLAAAPPDRQV